MPKTLHVAFLPKLLPAGWHEKVKVAVVIDTLRFTTTACQAFAAGAKEVSVAADVATARGFAQRHSTPSLLCGERECRPIEGFDLGNSPYEYTTASVGGRGLVFTTTNGTLAVSAASSAEHIFLAALVNRRAIADALHDHSAAWVICSGTDGEIAGEDVLAAGAVLESVRRADPSLEFGNDSARMAWQSWRPLEALEGSAQQAAIVDAFGQYRGGSNLIENNYAGDLDFAASVDKLSVAPISNPQQKHIFAPRKTTQPSA